MTQTIDIDIKVSMTADEGQITMRSDLRFTVCINPSDLSAKAKDMTKWGGAEASFQQSKI